jgi:hypothetical protein
MAKKVNEHKPASWWQWLIMYPTLVVSLVGAVPQYKDWVTALRLGVPPGSVAQAEEQQQLWEKNFECARREEPRSVTTPTNIKVVVTPCPSGDVLVEVDTPDFGKNIRWIALNTFLRQAFVVPGIGEAFAAEGHPGAYNRSGSMAGGPRTASDSSRHAQFRQASSGVVCQKRLSNNHIIRRIRTEGGGCLDEVINPYTGQVVDSRPAPCNPSC